MKGEDTEMTAGFVELLVGTLRDVPRVYTGTFLKTEFLGDRQ